MKLLIEGGLGSVLRGQKGWREVEDRSSDAYSGSDGSNCCSC